MIYNQRTFESIQNEYSKYTIESVKELAKYLQHWMANELNDRNFIELFEKMNKEKCPPNIIVKALFGHAYDWFAFGN